MEEAISRYGLAAVFAGAYLEGDLTAILAGVVSHLGLIAYGPALLVVFAAGVGRDVTCYALGRWTPRARQTRAYERAAGAIERLAGRFGPLEILLAPFVYGARTASMIFWGVHGIGLPRFLVFDAVACALWALVLSGAGYLLSDRAESVIGEVKSAEKWLLAALVAAVGVLLLWRAAASSLPRKAGENRDGGNR